MKYELFTSDVLIIGGGGAAAMAAIPSSRNGAKVTLISKENSSVGGATIMSAGGTCAVFHPSDNVELFYNDLMKGGGFLNNTRLARILAEDSTRAVLKLEEYDFLLDKASLEPAVLTKKGEGHSWPRGYLDRREGLGFCHALSKALLNSGVDFHPETMVCNLLASHGQIIGVLGLNLVTGEYEVFNSKAVILATGGLGAIYKISTNSRGLSGDGYAMAWDAGAELVDMEMVQFLPLAFPYPKSREGVNIGMCSNFGLGTKLYNGLGERYMEKYDPGKLEFATRDIVSRANFIEIKEGRGTRNGAIIVDATDHDPNFLERHKNFQPHIYSMCKEVYGERAANWEAPFEAIPSQHFFMGGIRINENCETGIPGLFAVGEVSGGVHGANRLSGCALTEIFVFGDRLGSNVTRWANNQSLITPSATEVQDMIGQIEDISSIKPEGIRPFEVKQAIKEVMWNTFGPSREAQGMKQGLEKLKSIQDNDLQHITLGSRQERYNREKMEAIEATMMIKTAILVASAALHRTESRGSHYRSDFPALNDNKWLKNIILKKGTGGNVEISYKQVDPV